MDNPTATTDEFARRFIDSRASRIHSTFGVESHFNTSSSKYELKDVYHLTKTLEQVKETAPELIDDLEIDPTDCTWEDVLVEVERARDAANSCERRSRKLYRRPFKWLGDYAHMISPGLSAFPDEFGVIHGGLAVVLSIARHREQVRFKLLRAIETIPNAIHAAQSKERNFSMDEASLESIRLHRCLDDMRRTLLRILPELIKKLNPETIFGKAANVVKGANVDQLLAEISNSAEKVSVCARGLGDDRDTRTAATVVETHDIVSRTRGGVDHLQTQVAEVLRRQQSLQSQLDAISGKNWLFQFLKEYSKPELHRKPGPDFTRPPQTHLVDNNAPVITTTAFELLNILSVDHLTSLNDETIILRRGRSLPDDALCRTASMIQTREVQNLLNYPEPGVVAVDGCADRAQVARISPISFVCANLAQALRQNLNPVLAFFCGQHVNLTPDDDLQGPQGLVRGLLSQLVLALVQNGWMGETGGIALPVGSPCGTGSRPSDTAQHFFYTTDQTGGFQKDNSDSDGTILSLPDLCQLFHGLLRLIPPDTFVFCIVDGISYYERDIWRQDYDQVLTMFGDIVTDSTLACLFKVLLTSPTNRMQLPHDVIPHQKVELRRIRPGQTGGMGAGFAWSSRLAAVHASDSGTSYRNETFAGNLGGSDGFDAYGYHQGQDESTGGMEFGHHPESLLIAQYAKV
ncbi:hypothetical protein V8F33_010689 [Rhypophila sp. PSN 637]